MTENKVTHEDQLYLERKGVCDQVDGMLAVACQARAADPGTAFLTALKQSTTGAQVTRQYGDLTRDDSLTRSKAWKDMLVASFGSMATVPQIFASQSNRTDEFSVKLALSGDKNVADGGENFFYYDYSKWNLTSSVRTALANVAGHAKLQAAMDAMKQGEKINTTEKRAVFHIGLRGSGDAAVTVDGKEGSQKVTDAVAAELKKVERIATAVRDGAWKGSSGKAIQSVVHIGIGGSVLGTQAAVQALAPFGAKKGLATHFVSSLDNAQFQDVMAQCDVESTLFVVCTKTFTTAETLSLAEQAKKLVTAKFASDKAAVSKHFVAVSAAPARATAFGIDAANVIAFWDFVGGRYSIWSGVGVTLAIATGFDNFQQFLAGAKAMDTHFFETKELTKNIPAMMGLLGVFAQNVQQAAAHAVVPYASRMGLFPAYLQQLEMESNGKCTKPASGQLPDVRTGGVVFGSTGPESQHSFFQLLHQGTELVTVDLIGAVQAQQPSEGATQAQLAANMFAQAEALMVGHTRDDIARAAAKTNEGLQHQDLTSRVLIGSKSNATMLFKKLTPFALGALMAAYEHKVFVQGAVWGINSFDQFGVERGKKLATVLAQQLGKDKPHVGDHDNSTNALVNLFNQHAQ